MERWARVRDTWAGCSCQRRALFPAALAVIFSGIFFAAYAFGAMKYRIRGMWWLATFSALLGLWVYERDGSPGDSLAFVILRQCVALVVSDGVRLWRFLNFYPRPSENGA